jgi:toxin-antitoxin system PIN domain toxin
MSRIALPDVNLLVALFDPDHIHHELAHDWFSGQRSEGWATCPVTENGFVRVLANPAYGGPAARPVELLDRLRTFCSSGHHHFWPDAVSFRDRALFNPPFVAGHRQITDIYLLGLARKMGGRLATFDRAIPVKAVVGAKAEHLQVLIAVDEE